MSDEREPYKLLSFRMFVKVHPDELTVDKNSPEYDIQALRLVYTNLIAAYHNMPEAYQQKFSTEELREQDSPDISGQALNDITPSNDLGADELRFILFPGSVLVGIREWDAASIQKVEAELRADIEAAMPKEGKGKVLKFPK